MGKKQYIRFEYDAPAFVIGIASNDRIWKLCWNINQAMELELSTGAMDAGTARGPEIYADYESQPDFEVLVFENTVKGRKVPKKAQPFRFWMVLKPRKEDVSDLSEILETLKTVENVSLAIDLSDEKDIKKLIP